jgi:hypothetical protein
MGYSPYFTAHGLHPILPFDINKATYLLPPPDKILTTEDLIVHRACQLQWQLTNINDLCKKIYQAQLENMHRFALKHLTKIKNYKFTTGDLVLVRNTAIEKSLDHKMRPRYLGPYIVISRNTGSAYILVELDGTILKNTIGADEHGRAVHHGNRSIGTIDRHTNITFCQSAHSCLPTRAVSAEATSSLGASPLASPTVNRGPADLPITTTIPSLLP